MKYYLTLTYVQHTRYLTEEEVQEYIENGQLEIDDGKVEVCCHSIEEDFFDKDSLWLEDAEIKEAKLEIKK